MHDRVTRRDALKLGGATAGLFAIGGLAACGSSKSGSTTSTAAAQTTKDVTVNYWTHDKVLSVPLLQYWGKTLGDEPHPAYRYTLKPTILTVDTLPTKARAAFLSRSNAPDLLNIEISRFSQLMPIAKDTLLDLTDAVNAVKSDNLDNLWRPYSVDGRIYGVELSPAWTTYYYRADQFKALGLPDGFDTWDDLLAVGQSKVVPKGKALGMVSTGGPIDAATWFVPYLFQAGGQVFNEDGSVALNSQQAVTALTFLTKAVQSNVFQALSNPLAGPGAVALKRGKIIGTTGADWYNKFVLQPTVPNQKGKWRMGPLPRIAGGGPQVSVFGGACFSVAKNSKVADACKELVKAAILTQQAQVKKLELVNFQPTWKSVYDSPAVLDKTEPFMDGEKIGQLYADITKDAPSVVQSPYMFQSLSIINDAVVAAYKGSKSPQAAIADASSQIQSKVKG
jgi:ABC-type glycerol-3-phosphate transport system substrate-binding protein